MDGMSSGVQEMSPEDVKFSFGTKMNFSGERSCDVMVWSIRKRANLVLRKA